MNIDCRNWWRTADYVFGIPTTTLQQGVDTIFKFIYDYVTRVLARLSRSTTAARLRYPSVGQDYQDRQRLQLHFDWHEYQSHHTKGVRENEEVINDCLVEITLSNFRLYCCVGKRLYLLNDYAVHIIEKSLIWINLVLHWILLNSIRNNIYYYLIFI